MKFITDNHIKARVGVDLLFVLPKSAHGSGIYKIQFKEKFYIGKAVNLSRRFKEHKRTILTHLKKEEFGSVGVYHKIMRHLWLNPSVTKAKISVIEYCSTELLTDRECFWINKHRGNPNFLNHASYF